ncbi:hypothetical protein [Gordonia sputi]
MRAQDVRGDRVGPCEIDDELDEFDNIGSAASSRFVMNAPR